MAFFSTKYLLHYLILLLVFLFVYTYCFDAKVFLGGDNASYYNLAKGLAAGKGYVNSNGYIATTANHYPPGYSFLMSLFMRIGFEGVMAMKILNGFFFFLASLFTYQIALKLNKENSIFALTIGLLFLLNSVVLEYSSILMSEMAFLIVLLMTIYFFILSNERDFSLKSPYLYVFLICLVLLIYVRSQGVVFVIAALTFLLMKKQFIPAIVCFSFVFLAMLPWQIRSNNLGGNSYSKQLMKVNPYAPDSPKMASGDWAERIQKNFVRYASKEIPKLMVPSLEVKYMNRETGKPYKAPFYYWIIGVLVMFFVVYGIWINKTYRYFFLLLFAGTFSVHMLWPDVWYGTRFLLPMAPLIILFFVLGFYKLLTRLFNKEKPVSTNKFVYLPFLLIALFSFKSTEALHVKAEKEHPKNWANFFKMGEWAKDNLPEDMIVVNRKPMLFYMSSQHKSIGFPSITDPEEFYNYFDEHKVTHVVIEQLGFNQTGKYLSPLIEKGRDKFKLINSYGVEDLTGKNAKGEVVTIKNPYGVWLFEYIPEKGYQGGYKNGLKEGPGTYNFLNENVFQGVWINDTINGPGRLWIGKDKNQEFVGNWKDNRKDGLFRFRKMNTWYECMYRQDTLQQYGYRLDADNNRTQKMRFN